MTDRQTDRQTNTCTEYTLNKTFSIYPLENDKKKDRDRYTMCTVHRIASLHDSTKKDMLWLSECYDVLISWTCDHFTGL